MAKGSQLSQLKNALNQAGLARQQQNGKKRKRTPLDEKEKERKAAKLREIQEKMNPFDVKVTKMKHDVGGRKVSGVVGRPAQSKQAGIEQRKKTLLKELQDRNRSGGIIDRRFGENDPTMTPEERMLERFTRERQRASKGDAFNLEDEDELTHYGQSLSKLDDFDNVGFGLDNEDEDEGETSGMAVRRSHFGGFDEDENDDDDDDDQPERKKTKAEVMAEVMAKSKEHKIMRQAQQEEDEDLRHELDQELDSLRSLLYAPDPATQVTTEAEAEAEPRSEIHPDATLAIAIREEDKEYDQFVRELAFEKRAKPKDRTKTEEELAKEEKEALEQAERQRIRRMNGEEESDSEGDAGKRKRRKHRGGDDLEDDFMNEDREWGGLGTGLDEADPAVISEDEEDGEESEDEEEDGEESEGEDESDGESEGEEGDEELLVKASAKTKKKLSSSGDKKELPYTFSCPSTHEEFLEIIEDVEDKDVPTVVKRIRALHHPSLAEDNKFKLQGLTGVLIDHILYITSPPTPRFSLLSALIPHLFALTKQYPIHTAQVFLSKLTLMHKNLRRGLAHGASDPTSKTFPGLPELAFLRVLGLVWPTSDMSHAVVSPARLLMGAYLGLCRVRSLRDVASGLFVCTLLLQYEEMSKRFVPEAVNFLINAVLHLAPSRFEGKGAEGLPGTFPTPDFRGAQCAGLKIGTGKARKLSVQKPDLTKLLSEDVSDTDEQAKVDLLGTAVDLLGQYGDLYKSLSGFTELYQPVVRVLEGVHAEKLPEDLRTKLSSTLTTLARLLTFSLQARRPLALQAHKPIPIPSYIPRFEHTSSNYLRSRDPDHERAESAKLRAQYKRERKGAVRELRKDARFLAAEQQKAQKEKDRAYGERMRRVLGSIEGERAEEKKMERKKAKMKEQRRAGRK